MPGNDKIVEEAEKSYEVVVEKKKEKENGIGNNSEQPKHDEHTANTDSIFECFECEYKTKTKSELMSHVHLQHLQVKVQKEIYLQCYECEYTAKDKKELKSHVKSKHMEIKTQKEVYFECSECDFAYKTKSDLKKHTKAQHRQTSVQQEIVFVCHQCDYSTNIKNDLVNHHRTHHSEMDKQKEYCYTCHECNSTARDLNELRSHMNTKHRQVMQYKCSFCEYVSALVIDLQNHTFQCHRNATGTLRKIQVKDDNNIAKDRPCEKCEILTNEIKEMKQYNENQNIPRTTLKCNFCESTFDDQTAFQNHVQNAHCPNKILCKYCDSSFVSSKQLQEHALTTHNIPSQDENSFMNPPPFQNHPPVTISNSQSPPPVERPPVILPVPNQNKIVSPPYRPKVRFNQSVTVIRYSVLKQTSDRQTDKVRQRPTEQSHGGYSSRREQRHNRSEGDSSRGEQRHNRSEGRREKYTQKSPHCPKCRLLFSSEHERYQHVDEYHVIDTRRPYEYTNTDYDHYDQSSSSYYYHDAPKNMMREGARN